MRDRDCSGRGTRSCACSPRRAARTRSSSPSRRPRPGHHAIWSGRRSVTPARSARRRASRSSRQRSTTTPFHATFGRRHPQSGRRPAHRCRHDRRPADRRPGGEAASALTPSTPASSGWSSHAAVGGRLWTPGIQVGVQPGSWFHLTECFGPVLGVMRADDLDHAIELQNASPYRAHRRHPNPRRRRDRPLARWCGGGRRLRQPRHHRCDRAAPAVRRVEALVRRRRAEGGWTRLRRRTGHGRSDDARPRLRA